MPLKKILRANTIFVHVKVSQIRDVWRCILTSPHQSRSSGTFNITILIKIIRILIKIRRRRRITRSRGEENEEIEAEEEIYVYTMDTKTSIISCYLEVVIIFQYHRVHVPSDDY